MCLLGSRVEPRLQGGNAMRKLLAVTTICLAAAQMQAAFAQTPTSRESEEASAQTPRMSFPQQHLYRRASYEAQQRALRLDSCKWQGVSPSRPDVYPFDVNVLMLGRGPWDRYHPSYPVRSWYYRPW